MHAKFKNSENTRTEMEKENRILKIEREQFIRKMKVMNGPVDKTIQQTALELEVETELETESETELENDSFHPPRQLFKRSPQSSSLNVSKLVPSIRPKGLTLPRGSITGTGKRSKIIEMPDGSKRIV